MHPGTSGRVFHWVRLVWSERSGADCVLALCCAGVEALVFAGEAAAGIPGHGSGNASTAGPAPPARTRAEQAAMPASELGAWLRHQRENLNWGKREMARRLIDAGRACGDNFLPSLKTMTHNVYRWERGDHDLTERYKLYYCKALAIAPGTFGPHAPGAGPSPLAALRARPASSSPAASDRAPGRAEPGRPAPTRIDRRRLPWNVRLRYGRFHG